MQWDPNIGLVHQMLVILILKGVPEFAFHPTWHSKLLKTRLEYKTHWKCILVFRWWLIIGFEYWIDKVWYSAVSGIRVFDIQILTVLYFTQNCIYAILNVFLFQMNHCSKQYLIVDICCMLNNRLLWKNYVFLI